MHIDSTTCFFCGKSLDKGTRERHHCIPKCLKPKINIIIPLHKKCHEKINAIYVSQQKKDVSIKLKNILSDTIVKLTDAHDKIEKRCKEK